MSEEEELKNKTFAVIKSIAQSRMAPDINTPFFMIQIIEL
jgi:hypothetical protein